MTPSQIELTLPGQPDNAVVLRTMAGDAAATAGLSYDRWEDLELAVDELTTLLLRAVPAAIRCVLRPAPDGVAVEMSAIEPRGDVPHDQLAELVLAGVTAELVLSFTADPPHGSFVVSSV